ncbi:MAG: DNA methyltransferase [Candidatus Delongbacteria bacterium]|jgi:DNA modification methylase|nr:DNA methyltransferase [Candidatus Delongbacteria bacterium]
MDLIVDRIDELSHLISPRRDIKKPIYNWHSFKHSYSKELVDVLIKEFKLKKDSWVMDPFCGGGTTLLACKQAGINAHGVDILPFSVFLSAVKTTDFSSQELMNTHNTIKNHKISKTSLDYSLPDIELYHKAFNSGIKSELFKIKEKIENIKNTKNKDFFNLAFLGILEAVSNTKKAGGFLRLVDNKIKPDTVAGLFDNKVNQMIDDIAKAENENKCDIVKIKVFQGDAREIKTGKKYDAIITSPPYPNRHDYTRIYSLEMAFDFIKNNNELKNIRYQTLRSHVEARKKYEINDFKCPDQLEEVISRIRKEKLNNNQIIPMLYGYFEDMFLVMKEMDKVIKKRGKVAIVVSNVRFAGVNVPVDEILLQIGENIGFKPVSIWLTRLRGNSAQQMKDYSRVPSRESVVILEKR